MSGCFGNHPVDRYLESQLFQYLDDSERISCPKCDHTEHYEKFEWDDDDNCYCPSCGFYIEEEG